MDAPLRRFFPTLLRFVAGLALAITGTSTLEACLCADCRRDGGMMGTGDDGGTMQDGRVGMDGMVFPDAGCFPQGMTIVCRTPPDGGTPRDGGNPAIPLPTNGSASTLTKDDAVGLFITHYYGARMGHGRVGITKYGVDFTANTLMQNGSYDMLDEAYQAIIAQDDDTAYVASETGVIKFTNVSRPGVAPMLAAQNPAGSEPRGVALTPSGKLLFVANWSDGTVTIFNTEDLSVKSTIDLNTPLAQSGMLGPSVMNQNPARPALAHPWAIAVTDHGNGVDDEETVYVTEYFSQERTSGVPTDDTQWDLGRQGVVYHFNVMSETVEITTIAPRAISDPLFIDSNNFTTGCFPNQLNAATIHGGRLYVTALCASPRGPIGPTVDLMTGDDSNTQNFKSVVHPAIFVIDTATDMEVPGQGRLLDVDFLHAYERDGVMDDASRRMPLLLSDIAFEPGTDTAYLTAYGADALFRVEYGSDGSFVRVGAPARTSTGTPTYFIDLNTKGTVGRKVAHLPRGLAISRAGHRALVINDTSRNISIVDLDNQALITNIDLPMATASGLEASVNEGRHSFVTGLDRWSYRGQAWSSCEACHPNGYSDNVTWFLETGPRQTPSLDSAFGSMTPTLQKFLRWGANADEVHDFELFTRRISGGVGAIVHDVSEPPVNADRIVFAGENPIPPGQISTGTQRNDWINGSTMGLMPGGATATVSMIPDLTRIQTYIQVVHPTHAPSNLSPTDAAQGTNFFLNNNCTACHGGEQWTISRRFYTPSQMNNDPFQGALLSSYTAAASFPMGLNPPSDGAGRSATLRSPADPHDLRTLNDSQIYCILRAVGTFPSTLDANKTGVAPVGVRVREVRADMMTDAQGAYGYNPPSVLSVALTAPYLHAGNARTLEELFSDTFRAHANAMVLTGQFPGSANRDVAVRQLVAFLLSVDTSMVAPDPPEQLGGFDPLLCPLRFGM
jgi:DNA-binding beta-propeller fold protein YncE